MCYFNNFEQTCNWLWVISKYCWLVCLFHLENDTWNCVSFEKTFTNMLVSFRFCVFRKTYVNFPPVWLSFFQIDQSKLNIHLLCRALYILCCIAIQVNGRLAALYLPDESGAGAAGGFYCIPQSPLQKQASQYQSICHQEQFFTLFSLEIKQ